MNRKQKIIISVTGIFLVFLILVGLTYAYFLTKINGNTNDKSISVTTANLEIEYKDNNDIITGDKIEPGTTLPTKVFTVINNGNMNVEYSVGLVNLINTFSITEDVVYTVNCKSYDKEGFVLNSDGTVTGTENGSCSGVNETEFPTLNSYIVTNNIDVNIVHAYTMTVTYKETGTDQSIDMNKELSAKIDIFDPKSLTIQGSVTNSSENDYVVIHSKEQESQILNGNYRFIGITPDKHTITIKNRNTTDTKSASLDVEKGTPSVSGSKIIYDEDKNIADMGISISDSTLTLDITKITNPTRTLKDTILLSAKKGGENRTVMGSTVTEFTSISGENERVLNNAPDDYGTSYYFRGNVLDNYVTFADKTWRIVRINGDGSVRLVLDDVAKDASGNVIETAFNSSANDNAYIGYMYGMTGQTDTSINQCIKLNNAGNAAEVDTTKSSQTDCERAGYKWASTPYDATHVNIVSSTVKKSLDSWYKTNIIDTNNNQYISDTLFCGDKTISSRLIGSSDTGKGYGDIQTAYSSEERIVATSRVKPLLKCAENATNAYSRFTVSITTLSNGNKTNGDLKYPIGLLSMDEAEFTGAYRYETNKTYYLYNSFLTSNWWLLTVEGFAHSGAVIWTFDSTGQTSGHFVDASFTSVSDYASRPVINIKSSALADSGDGTSSNPYTLKLS